MFEFVLDGPGGSFGEGRGEYAGEGRQADGEIAYFGDTMIQNRLRYATELPIRPDLGLNSVKVHTPDGESVDSEAIIRRPCNGSGFTSASSVRAAKSEPKKGRRIFPGLMGK